MLVTIFKSRRAPEIKLKKTCLSIELLVSRHLIKTAFIHFLIMEDLLGPNDCELLLSSLSSVTKHSIETINWRR